jgi:hypothetical protein
MNGATIIIDKFPIFVSCLILIHIPIKELINQTTLRKSLFRLLESTPPIPIIIPKKIVEIIKEIKVVT